MTRVLLDTNTLLLFLVGSVEPQRIGGRRLQQFDGDDFGRLLQQLSRFTRHVTVPNVLTEVSNLIGSGRQKISEAVLLAFRNYCLRIEEQYEPSRLVSDQQYFSELGLADAVLMRVADGNTTVFTVDHQLTGRLERAGIETINLMRFKTP